LVLYSLLLSLLFPCVRLYLLQFKYSCNSSQDIGVEDASIFRVRYFLILDISNS